MSENKTYPVFENIARKSHIPQKKKPSRCIFAPKTKHALWATSQKQNVFLFGVILIQLTSRLGPIQGMNALSVHRT